VRILLITLLLAFSTAAMADVQPKVKGPKLVRPDTPAAEKGAGRGMTSGEMAKAVFSEVEKRVIRDFFNDRTRKHGEADKVKGAASDKGKSKSMPAGLAKRDELPPGLERHVERFGTLPPGLAKRDLPYDLDRLLPRRAAGLSRKIVGSDVVLIEEATGLVLDVVEGVLGERQRAR
jgi:hypothetical protein